jgi:ribosomal protein S18 acetylase RimI-like enzyme
MERVPSSKNSTVSLRLPANFIATTLRPEGPEDGPFLLELYAATRQEELDAIAWPAAMREAFVRMQFNAQQQGYRAAFPRAEFAIILQGGQPAGRIVIDRAENGFLLVDMALLPTHRGRGLGTALMQELLREAASAAKRVRLSVLKGQRASRLYQRLGFEKTGEDGQRDQMEWRGGRLGPNDPKPCEPA